MSADIVNALFEVFGAVFLSFNIVRLYKDKVLTGVSVVPTTFYTTWGLWNIYFYPATGNYLSGIAGVLVVVVNATWLGMALYYSRGKKFKGT